mmetsp:Transcript_57345/g.185843  ORF Transcript_57345/g.185843 Transcript_57345/m.185843 type:complete len:233 (+) Transcript_57345:431-1129(+)
MTNSNWRRAFSNFELLRRPHPTPPSPTRTGRMDKTTAKNIHMPPVKLSHIDMKSAEPRKTSVIPLPVKRVMNWRYFPMYSFASVTVLMVLRQGVSRTANMVPKSNKYVIKSQSTTLSVKTKLKPLKRAPATTQHAAAKKNLAERAAPAGTFHLHIAIATSCSGVVATCWSIASARRPEASLWRSAVAIARWLSEATPSRAGVRAPTLEAVTALLRAWHRHGGASYTSSLHQI